MVILDDLRATGNNQCIEPYENGEAPSSSPSHLTHRASPLIEGVFSKRSSMASQSLRMVVL